MKKTKSVLLLLITAIFMLSGCSKSSSYAKNNPPLTITLWHYYNGDAKASFDNLVQEFNETIGKDKGIIVDAYTQGGVNELAEAVLASARKDVGSQEMPNIFSAYSDNAFRLDGMSVVAELDKYFTESELKEYRSEFIDDGRLGNNNSLKIIPVAKSSEISFINLTDFDKFAKESNVTVDDLQTWEGLAKTAAIYYDWTDKSTDTTDDGKALFGIDSMANFMLIAAKQLGVDIYQSTNGKVSFNFPKEAAKTIWDCFYVPYISGFYSNIGRFRSDDAKTGSIIMYTGSNSGANYFPKLVETGKDASYPIECVTLPYPHFSSGEKYAIQQGAGMVVAKTDEKQVAASVQFLKWLTSIDHNLQFAISTGYLPVKNEALEYKTVVDKIISSKDVDEKSTTMQAIKTTYDMLGSYTLYANKPFEGSYETRSVLNSSLQNYATKDLEEIKKEISSGKSRSEAIAAYNTDENFERWYNAIVSDMSDKLGSK